MQCSRMYVTMHTGRGRSEETSKLWSFPSCEVIHGEARCRVYHAPRLVCLEPSE